MDVNFSNRFDNGGYVTSINSKKGDGRVSGDEAKKALGLPEPTIGAVVNFFTPVFEATLPASLLSPALTIAAQRAQIGLSTTIDKPNHPYSVEQLYKAIMTTLTGNFKSVHDLNKANGDETMVASIALKDIETPKLQEYFQRFSNAIGGPESLGDREFLLAVNNYLRTKQGKSPDSVSFDNFLRDIQPARFLITKAIISDIDSTLYGGTTWQIKSVTDFKHSASADAIADPKYEALVEQYNGDAHAATLAHILFNVLPNMIKDIEGK